MWYQRVLRRFALISLCALLSGCALLFNEVESSLGDGSNGEVAGEIFSLTYSVDSYAGFVSDAIDAITPTATGAISFSISPSLPSGISIDETTGEISGIPVSASPLSTYTITASDGSDTATFDLDFEVVSGFKINSTADTSDLDDSDGVCDAGGGVCTLRAAIEENRNAAGGPILDIYIPDGTYTLAALPWMTYSGNVIGESRDGVILDGNGIDFVDNSSVDITVVARNFTIQGDNVGTLISDADGGSSSVTMTNVFWKNNISSTQGSGIRALTAAGLTLTVEDSRFEGNTTTTFGGAIYFEASGGQLNIRRTQFVNNFATNGDGGVLVNNGPTAVIEDCEFDGNTVDVGGSGGHAVTVRNNSDVTIRRSMFTAHSSGEGLVNVISAATLSTVTIENVTISDNERPPIGAYSGADITITNVTIADNIVPAIPFRGAAFTTNNAGSTIDVSNSIFFGNTIGGSTDPNCVDQSSGVTSSSGYNITDTDTTDCPGFNQTGDQISVTSGELNLEALADNGGYTRTRALGDGSFALDQNNSGTCGSTIVEDQRGVTRPQNGNCDVGAYEAE